MHSEPDTAARLWRVRTGLPVLKLAAAALLVAFGVLVGAGDPVSIGVAALAAAALVGWGVRDLVAPVRLAADTTGVTVIQGYAGRRHIPWPAVERIVVDTRPRLGLAVETLEIDTGASLHLFGRYDLGASPAEVADVLEALRSGRPVS